MSSTCTFRMRYGDHLAKYFRMPSSCQLAASCEGCGGLFCQPSLRVRTPRLWHDCRLPTSGASWCLPTSGTYTRACAHLSFCLNNFLSGSTPPKLPKRNRLPRSTKKKRSGMRRNWKFESGSSLVRADPNFCFFVPFFKRRFWLFKHYWSFFWGAQGTATLYRSKNRTHDFRTTSRCAGYLLVHSGDEGWNYLKDYWPCAGGLSVVNAIGSVPSWSGHAIAWPMAFTTESPPAQGQ